MDKLTGREKERRQMVREALQDKNPVLFQQLKKAGKLEEFVEDREQEMYAAYTEGLNKVIWDNAQEKSHKGSILEQAKEIEANLRILWESILETYLEF